MCLHSKIQILKLQKNTKYIFGVNILLFGIQRLKVIFIFKIIIVNDTDIC